MRGIDPPSSKCRTTGLCTHLAAVGLPGRGLAGPTSATRTSHWPWVETPPVGVLTRSTHGDDGDRRPQRAADHLPRPLRLATGDHDVDLRWLEDFDHIVWLGLEARGVRLDAGHRARAHEVLNPLIVPVLSRGHQRIVRAPGNQLFLRVETEIDIAARHDRIHHKQWLTVLLDCGE